MSLARVRLRLVLALTFSLIIGCSAITSFDNFVGNGVVDDNTLDSGNDVSSSNDASNDAVVDDRNVSDVADSAPDASSSSSLDADGASTDGAPDVDANIDEPDADAGPSCIIKSTGKLSCAQTAAAGGGGQNWNAISNIVAADGLVASASLGVGGETIFVIAKDFGVSVPSNAEIRGVQVYIIARQDGAGARDREVRLNPVNIGQSDDRNKASDLPTTLSLLTYGSPTDTWGVALKPGDVQNASFAAGIVFRNYGVTLTTVEVDQIQIEVTYCEPQN